MYDGDVFADYYYFTLDYYHDDRYDIPTSTLQKYAKEIKTHLKTLGFLIFYYNDVDVDPDNIFITTTYFGPDLIIFKDE